MNNKYEFTGETRVSPFGTTLHRIRAIKNFGNIRIGEFGGWIEKESNLSTCDDAWVYGDARVYDDAWVYDNAWVYGDARVYDNARVCGDARVYGDARVEKTSHYLTVGPIGSRGDTTTFYRTRDESIYVKCGCFNDDIERFLEKVEYTHGDNIHGRSYRLAAEIAKLSISGSEEK